MLLFGKQRQRFLISSEVKRANFHGTTRSKPILFYRTYKGTEFETTDQAVDFVISKLNVAVGTREHSTQAPVAYEMLSEDNGGRCFPISPTFLAIFRGAANV